LPKFWSWGLYSSFCSSEFDEAESEMLRQDANSLKMRHLRPGANLQQKWLLNEIVFGISC